MNSILTDKTKINSFVESALIDIFSKIFVVNINTGEFEVYKNNELLDEDDLEGITNIYDYIQKLITDQMIYPEYATACKRLTNPEYVRKSIFSGEKRIVQSYRRRTFEGDKWITVSIIAGNSCSPENPMVLFTWRGADTDAITLLDTLPTVSSLYDKLIRINLSNNTYEPVLVDDDEQGRLVAGVINMYEWWASYSKDGNIAAEDIGVFSKITDPEGLKQHFIKDPTPISFRYRRKIGDEFRWVKLEIAPSVEYSENNQVMLLSLKDVHEEYTAQTRRRQELIDNMSRDALTNLFNRLKFNRDNEELAKTNGPLYTCIYIDVNGLHELNNLLGHRKGDEMLCSVADALRMFFPDESVYRIGGDEFVVSSTKLSKSEMELSVADVRRELFKNDYEISAGIATGACGDNIEGIVAAAELEMRNDKSAYYERNGDIRRKRQLNEQLEQMLIEKHDNEQFLNIIAHQFSGVYLVDLASDTLRHIYIPDFFSELLEEAGNCFSAAMRIYVERYVKQEYHDCFYDAIDFDKLKIMLRDGRSLKFTYEKTDGTFLNVQILEADKTRDSASETVWIFGKEH